MKNLLKEKACFLVCSLYFLYVLIQGICLIYTGDDFIWFQSQSLMEYFREKAVNGRYFTNTVTFLIIHHPMLRVIVYTVVHYLLFYYVAKLITREKAHRWISYAFTAIAMLSMSLEIYRQTTSWISGFTNYYFAALFTVMYLNLCKETLCETKKNTHLLMFGYALAIGFLGSLCLETATILNLMLVSVYLVESLIRRKKIPAVHIVYLVGAAAGACCMFLNHNYSRFANGVEDEFGTRFVDVSFFDMMITVYQWFVSLYIRPFVFLNIVLAASLGYLYFRAYYVENKSHPKYGKASILLVLCYAAYSVLSEYLGGLVRVSVQYRTQSVEAAVMFLYVLAVLYLVWHLTSRKVFHWFTACCCASLISVLPFLIVNPVTARCFFCGYIFWTLAVGVLGYDTFFRAIRNTHVISAFKLCTVIGVGMYASIFGYMLILNKYCENIRVPYIKEQLEHHAPMLEVIELPYPVVQGDYLKKYMNEGPPDIKGIWDYQGAIENYYGFSETINEETPHQFVSMYSYTTDSLAVQ